MRRRNKDNIIRSELMVFVKKALCGIETYEIKKLKSELNKIQELHTLCLEEIGIPSVDLDKISESGESAMLYHLFHLLIKEELAMRYEQLASNVINVDFI